MMESFCKKYGVTKEQALQLYRDGVLSATAFERCEMKEHFLTKRNEGYKKMDAIWHTSFHFGKSLRSVFYAIK